MESYRRWSFVIHKDENNYTEDDSKKLDLNEVAMNILYYALSENDFNRICTCTTAKQIWDELENTHEGTSKVRDTKISLLCLTAYKIKIMVLNTLGFLEGEAIIGFLMGNNYPYWKCRMKIFFKAQHRLLWNVIEKGSFKIEGKEELER